jgi:hypothetical protein
MFIAAVVIVVMAVVVWGGLWALRVQAEHHMATRLGAAVRKNPRVPQGIFSCV